MIAHIPSDLLARLNLGVPGSLIALHNPDAFVEVDLCDVADHIGPEVGLDHSGVHLPVFDLLLGVQLQLGVAGSAGELVSPGILLEGP